MTLTSRHKVLTIRQIAEFALMRDDVELALMARNAEQMYFAGKLRGHDNATWIELLSTYRQRLN